MAGMARIVTFALVMVLIGAPALAQFQGLPNALRHGVQNAAISAAAYQLNKYLQTNQPIVRDWGHLYPRVDFLPGPPFRPVTPPQSAWGRSLAANDYMGISLPPGDYQFPLQLFCMHWSGGSAPGFTYMLGPMLGTRARMMRTMVGRAAIRHILGYGVQVLVWAIQSGDSYEQLSPESRALFDNLVPEFRDQMGPGFLVQTREYWQSLGQAIPGLPSFDAAMNSLGPASVLLNAYARDENALAEYGWNYEELRAHLIMFAIRINGGPKPWNRVAPGVYERMITDSVAMGLGTLQIRITRAAVSAQNPTALALTGAAMGYPLECADCQTPVVAGILPTGSGTISEVDVRTRASWLFRPILSRSGVFSPGFSASGNFTFTGDVYANTVGYIYVHPGGTMAFRFSVPNGRTLVVAYGILAGHPVNNGAFTVSINGSRPRVIAAGIGGYRETVPSKLILWSHTFSGGTYVLRLGATTDDVNIYGLWLHR